MILKFQTFDECQCEPPKNWAVKGVVALGEDSSWYGKPGSLKSALLTDMHYHLAAGRTWRGHKVRRPLASVIFAFERAGLTRRRLRAYAQRDGLSNLPLAVCDQIIDLIDIGCVETITQTVTAAQDKFGVPVGLISFDTYSKGVAAGGGDEDKAQHVNLIAANLKRVHEELTNPIHIATVGHVGWNGGHERGSSAKLGHVDLAVEIAGDLVRTAKIVKANDQAEGNLTSFQMETIDLGRDEDGEPLAVGILSRSEAAAPKATKISDKQRNAIAALDRLGGRATVEAWRQELLSCGTLDKGGANPRAAFKRLKEALVASGEVIERDDYVSRPGATGFPMPPPMAAPIIVPPPPRRFDS